MNPIIDYKPIRNQHLAFIGVVFATLLACSFPLFYQLDKKPIRQWDESRNAMNALEMLHNKNYLVRYYDGAPETWETKPPLLIWLQVMSLKIFGLNEWSIRFPTLLATLGTVLMLVLYFRRNTLSRYAGCIAALILVTSNGYIDPHIARTGDHDALLVFFLLATILLFYQYLQSENPRKFLIPSVALVFTLAVLTKSVAAFFILPALAINLIVFKSGKKLLTDRIFYVSVFGMLLILTGYYTIREFMQPGYLSLVWHEEFLRFTNSENRFDSQTPWYYLINFIQWRYVPWIYVLIAAFFLLPLMIPKSEKPFYWYIGIHALTFLVLISMGSKNLWYDGLLFPLFSIFIALFFVYGIHFLKRRFPGIPVEKIMILLLILAIMYPYISIIKKVSDTNEYPWDQELYGMSYILRDTDLLNSMPKPLHVVYDGYPAHLLFYVKAHNLRQGTKQIKMAGPSQLQPGNTIIFSQTAVADSIQKAFRLDTLFYKEQTVVARILESP